MQRQVFDCDKCGDKEKALNISLKVDRAMDAAGSVDDVYSDIDLCPNCLRAAIHWLLEEKHPEAAKSFIRIFSPERVGGER